MSAEDLLKLPWDLQVPLASGYAAYVLAYTGLRDRQKTVDVAFISLVFSLIATAMLALAAKYGVEPIKASGLAFAVTVLSGALWRRLGRPLVGWGLRATDITWANDDPSALATLSESTKCYVTQVGVQLDDGSWLSCQNAVDFAQAPFGPFQLGPSGDIALYVTDITEADGTDKPQLTLRDSEYGDRITYVPASRVKRITVRYLRRPSRSWRAGAVAFARSRPEPKEPLAAP